MPLGPEAPGLLGDGGGNGQEERLHGTEWVTGILFPVTG